MFKSLKGMPDVLPDEAARWQALESRLQRILSSFGYREIRTPVMEETELFARSIGGGTDVVEKEMFTFQDKGGTSMTLRPENTAGVMRAYIENNMAHGNPLTKLYYIGPMFRHERPQKGRFRQFSQIGVEAIGGNNPWIDTDVIALLMTICRQFGLADLKLEINSVGDNNCRPAYRKTLQTFLRSRSEDLCDNCKQRTETNPLRVFDCKAETCQKAIADAPVISDHLCAECSAHFESVKKNLGSTGIPFVHNPRIVRGLDYYTRTAFEVTAGGLGSQNAVGGGGRYDGLAQQLGGSSVPAVGFAMGIERLLLAADFKPAETAKRIDFIPLDPAAEATAVQLAAELRSKAIGNNLPVIVEINFSGGSLKSALRQADKNKTAFAVLIGGNELQKKAAVVKNLLEHTQEEVPFADICSILLKN